MASPPFPSDFLFVLSVCSLYVRPFIPGTPEGTWYVMRRSSSPYVLELVINYYQVGSTGTYVRTYVHTYQVPGRYHMIAEPLVCQVSGVRCPVLPRVQSLVRGSVQRVIRVYSLDVYLVQNSTTVVDSRPIKTYRLQTAVVRNTGHLRVLIPWYTLIYQVSGTWYLVLFTGGTSWCSNEDQICRLL